MYVQLKRAVIWRDTFQIKERWLHCCPGFSPRQRGNFKTAAYFKKSVLDPTQIPHYIYTTVLSLSGLLAPSVSPRSKHEFIILCSALLFLLTSKSWLQHPLCWWLYNSHFLTRALSGTYLESGTYMVLSKFLISTCQRTSSVIHPLSSEIKCV